jgi:hypothetical protein
MKPLPAAFLTFAFAGLAVCLPLAQAQRAAQQPAPAAAASAPSTQGTVAIRSISPPFTESLQAGQRVRITAVVAFTQPGTGATIALSLQEPPPTQRPLGASAMQVQALAGTVSLSTELVVPDTPSLKVYVPLYTHLGSATSVVATGSYQVIPRR